MTDIEATEFVDLVVDNDYEIGTTFPYVIRRKRDGFIPKEGIRNDGYFRVKLNGKSYSKHLLVALQFIENEDPVNYDQVDHINHNRTDYHIENLRWVSNSTNSINMSSLNGVVYEFIDDIPDDAIAIDYYDTKTERRYFQEKQYYYYNDDGNDIFYHRITDDGLYKIMHINTIKNGSRFVHMKDTNDRKVWVYVNKLKQQYDLV